MVRLIPCRFSRLQEIVVANHICDNFLKPTRPDSCFIGAIAHENLRSRRGAILVHFGFKEMLPVVHRQCQTNVNIGLVNRVLAAPKYHSYYSADDLHRLVTEFLVPHRSHIQKEINIDETRWIYKQPKAVRNRLLKCARLNLAPNEKQCYGNVFVKREIALKQIGETFEDKDPRIITASSVARNLNTGPFIFALSKAFTKVWSINNQDQPSPILYSSGHTTEDVASWLQFWRDKLGPNALLVDNDFSRFDQSVSEQWLQAEAMWMKSFIPRGYERSVGCNYFLRQNVKTSGYTQFDEKYTVKGTRRSGDQQTTLGNSFFNAFANCHAMRKLGLKLGQDFAIAVMGDDLIMVVKNNHKYDATIHRNELRYFGLDGDPGVKEDHDLEFCSMCFVPTTGANQLTPVPKPYRLMAKFGWCLPEHFNKRSIYADMLALRHLNTLPVFRQYIRIPEPVGGKILSEKEVHKFLPNQQINIDFAKFYGWYYSRYGTILSSDENMLRRILKPTGLLSAPVWLQERVARDM